VEAEIEAEEVVAVEVEEEGTGKGVVGKEVWKEGKLERLQSVISKTFLIRDWSSFGSHFTSRDCFAFKYWYRHCMSVL